MGTPGIIAPPANVFRPLDPSFDRSEEELQVNGLRASPAAPDPAENQGCQEKKEAEGQAEEQQQVEFFNAQDLAKKLQGKIV